MKYTTEDLKKLDHLILMLKDAKFEITGLDILKYAETFKWVGRLYKTVETDVTPPTPPKIQEQSSTPPVKSKSKMRTKIKTKGK